MFFLCASNVGFAGGTTEGELMVVGSRMYDPLAARFLSEDPIRQVVNQYSYTLGNPVRFWDPDGLQGVPTAADGELRSFIIKTYGGGYGWPVIQWGADVNAKVGVGVFVSVTWHPNEVTAKYDANDPAAAHRKNKLHFRCCRYVTG